MDKAPILSSKDIFDWLEKNNPMGDSSDADRYIQRDADHEYYMKRIQTLEASLDDVKNQHESKCKECHAWHDGALDWRELEVKRAQNRISELETEIAKFSPDKVRNILKKYLPENYFEGSFIERITNEICEE